jgi:hypothetical protein
MAHFAELDKNNKVLRIIVIADSDTADDKGVEKEEIGIAFCKSLFGEDTKWVQTSYNGKIRKIFAHKDGSYDPIEDAFIPCAVDEWHVFDKTTWMWKTPVPEPTTEGVHTWNSLKGEWETKSVE